LIGEKFRAALGIAAPVEVAALAVQPIEFTKRIAAAAKTVNVSFRMGSPIRVILFGLVSPRSVYPYFRIIVHQVGSIGIWFFHTTFKFLSRPVLN
jgi:hypothetical protein